MNLKDERQMNHMPVQTNMKLFTSWALRYKVPRLQESIAGKTSTLSLSGAEFGHHNFSQKLTSNAADKKKYVNWPIGP